MTLLYTVHEDILSHIDPPPTWHRAEKVVRKEYNLTEDHGSYHDARTRDDGTPVEIKSCACRYADGRLGRFEIWDSQLYQLDGDDGLFALIVYENEGLCTVVATHMCPAWKLYTKGTTTRSRHPTMGRKGRRRITWTDIIPFEKIHVCYKATFGHHYSEAEREEAVAIFAEDETAL